jgi:catechol 2,3-dioxygenase-like lactoylglutathione lyase family enzyme
MESGGQPSAPGSSEPARRYQIFLSSTYEDLQEERLEVMKVLLEMECIPCGMEYFPAASEDQWSYIKNLIASCDYYLVVVAGRYGSTDSAGLSFTEREYDLAIELGVPTLAFVHSDPESLAVKQVERGRQARGRLDRFRKKLKTKLCKGWSSRHELGSVVSTSLMQLIKRHPGIGWVRADVPHEAVHNDGEKIEPIFPVRGLHHVSLPVANLAKSVRFYQDILRLRQRARPDFGFPGAWFEFPDGQQLHLVEYRDKKDGPVTFRSGSDINFKDIHFAVRVRDYDEMHRILSQGVTTVLPGPRQFQCYILDPDNHIVEITGFDGPGPKRES